MDWTSWFKKIIDSSHDSSCSRNKMRFDSTHHSSKKSFMFRFTIQLRTVYKSEGLSDNFQIVHFVTKTTLIVVAPSMAKRPRTLKGLSVFFPKCWSYSVERVDEGGWPQQSKVFFSQICLTCKCQPFKVDPAASRYLYDQVASTLSNIPISPLT